MANFVANMVNPYVEKESLTAEEIVSLKKMMTMKGDFALVGKHYVSFGILDSLTVNLLTCKATEDQVKMMLSGSIPIVPEQRVYVVFFVLKSYKKLVKELFSFIKSDDQFFKQKLVQDCVFENEYLMYLVKLLKNDVEFISALIAEHKHSEAHLDVLIHSEEPEVLFRISNLTQLLRVNLALVKTLLHNPFTPDESVIQLKQLIHDLQQEEESKAELRKKIESEKKEETEALEDDTDSEKDSSDETGLDLLEKETPEIEKEVEGNLYAKVLTMNMPDKMKLAMKGNKSARMLLLKDPNKQISLAALGNPRITETEISFILKNRSTGEHLIREVARDRTWMKEYHIVRDLASHPKTPMEVSSKLLGRLYLSDLGRLAKSKDIPNNLRTMAARMFETKSKKN